MSVKKASNLDWIEHLSWLTKQEKVDWRTLDYPQMERYAADVDGKRVAYNHVHGTMTIESMAFNPESSPKERLEASLELVDNYCKRAAELGMREIWYMSSDERTDEAAMKHLGFERVVAFRKRI